MTTKQYDNYADLITFTRASTGTYLDSDGLLKTASTNVPRIEYDASGNRKGLLIEEARTNIFTNSGDMDGTGWTGFRTTYSAGDTSPDGSQLFLLGTASETNVNGSLAASQTHTLSAGAYTMSAFAKVGPTNTGLLLLRPTDTSNFTDAVQAWFNLENGTVAGTNVASGSSLITTPVATIQDWGGGVYRCTLTFTVTSSVSCAARHYIADASGSLAVTIGKQVQVWGVQLEAGSFPTSYIPTSGSTATRSADVASIIGANFSKFWNNSAGTFYIETHRDIAAPPSSFFRAFEVSDGTTNNRIRVLFGYGPTIGLAFDVFNQAALDLGSQVINAPIKVASAYKTNDFAAVRDAGVVQTDTSGSVSWSMNQLAIGSNATGGGSYFNGHIKSIQYYPRRLTNAQLQRLTA